jgi:ATPase
MGIIPQVIDTVIFIEAGKINEILQLQLTVKVPEGMNSDDLARPIIIISSFFTKKPLYEIYTFGEQIVVMPMEEIEKAESILPSKISEYAKNSVHKKLGELLPCEFLFQIKKNDIDLFVA